MAATKTANVNVRIQEDVKTKAEQILESMGISRATAIDMFYRQIIMHNGIPFPVTIPRELPAYDELSEADFNALMSTGYLQALTGNSYSVDEVFSEYLATLSNPSGNPSSNT